MSTTPNMNLIIPVPTLTDGPEWAQEVNVALEVVDDHDHTSGKGKKVPVAGIDVNQDFEINAFRLVEVKSVKMEPQSSTLSGVANNRSVYEYQGNLYWTNSGGIPVQLTNGNSIVSNIVIPASPLMPSGAVLDYAGISVPVGFLQCDGAAVSRTTYSALFSALGTIWGVGDGSTTFNLPNFSGRATIGVGTYSDPVTGSVTRSVTQQMGAAEHILTTAQMPSHNHGLNDPGHSHNIIVRNNGTTGGFYNGSTDGGAANGSFDNVALNGTGITLNPAGSGTSHNNMQPSIVVYKIIKT